MATPEHARSGLALVTTAAIAATRAAIAHAKSPKEVRGALFAAVPLIVNHYIDGSAALAVDWYEEHRDAASPPHSFTPQPLTVVREDKLTSAVAFATGELHDLEQRAAAAVTDAQVAEATDRALQVLEPVVQKATASGFRDTVTGNTTVDPDAEGWQRFARSGGCKFCLMLAERGAVYTQSSVRFAAHGNCNCVVGPSFDPNAPRASVMQHVASKRKRTAKERAALRDYLNHNFPDAPG